MCASRCGKIYGRHSNSLDVTQKCCGVCRGLLVSLGRFNKDGTPAKVMQLPSTLPIRTARLRLWLYQCARHGVHPQMD
jgi:hypothetical protein